MVVVGFDLYRSRRYNLVRWANYDKVDVIVDRGLRWLRWMLVELGRTDGDDGGWWCMMSEARAHWTEGS